MISKKRKIIYRLFYVLAGIILLIMFFAPVIIKNYVITNSEDLLGRQIYIGKLRYNYLSSTLKVVDFKMFEKNDKDEFTRFDTLIVNIEPYRLISNEKVFEQFYIKGLVVRTVMKDSVFNFGDLIDFHSKTSNIESEPDSFKYDISNIELKDAHFFFDNQIVGKKTHIENFSVLIPNISWNQEQKSNADLKFNFENGGYLESSLNIHPVDGDFDALLTIRNLELEHFYEYILEFAEINSVNGQLNSQIEINGNTNEVVKSLISGTIDVINFKLTDKNDKEFISAKNIHSTLNKVDYFNSSYIVDSLIIDEPNIYFKLDSETNNFLQIFKINDTVVAPVQEQKTNKPQGQNLYYAINHFEINNGITDYTDNLTGVPFKFHLSDIEINSDQILSDSKWIDVNAKMFLNNRGTLNANLGYNPTDLDNMSLDISIKEFLLSDLNIYTNYYMGHSILKGDMFYNSNSKITNGNIESENKLLIKNVSLDNTKRGVYNLPLKFALFILTDKNDEVILDIPVRGDLNDPSINVGKIVWKTFKNLIVKVATSPGRMLAGLVGGDPKDLEKITFNYLDTIPSIKNKNQLDKLLELEQKKKGLKIEMEYYVDKQIQREVIAKVETGKLFFKETNKDYLKDTADFKAFIINRTGTDPLEEEKAFITVATSNLVDSISKSNNKLRIKNTLDYLKTVNINTEISIVQSDSIPSEFMGLGPVLKINFSMLNTND